jgi:hypothetical protein
MCLNSRDTGRGILAEAHLISPATTKRYDVCLSFCGKQRDYAKRLTDLLSEHEVTAFYDAYETSDLWGEDLYTYLTYVYRDAARYCILFVSEEYAANCWTGHERKIAQARALESRTAYILPLRFDDTEIPGLLRTVGYVDARITTPEQLVPMLLKKLRSKPDDDSRPGGASRTKPRPATTTYPVEVHDSYGVYVGDGGTQFNTFGSGR